MSRESGPGSGARALAVLVAVLPMVMDPGGWFPYLSVRWAVLVGASGVGAVVVAVTSLRRRDRSTWASTAVRWWAACAAVVVAAVLASPARHVAWVGALDRRMGGLTWLAHGALFVAAVVAVRRRSDVGVIARGMVVGTLAVSLVTIAQQLGMDFPANAVNRARPGGPFGNADVLAAYCVLGVVIAVGVALDRSVSARWRIAAMSAAALTLATTAASGARGGWLGLSAAAAVLVGVGCRRLAVSRRRQAAGLAAALLLLVAVLAASGTLGRTLHVLDGTARGRIDTWTVAVDAVAERPLLGWGPDGMAEGLQRHIDDDYERRYTRRLLPDRAHTAPLDVAGTVGLVGLAAWIGLLVATARGAAAGARRDRSWTSLSIAAGLVGLAVCELSLFPTFDVDAIAWILAGALVGLGLPRAGIPPPSHRLGGVVAAAAVLAAVGLAVGAGIDAVAADRDARRAADALRAGQPAVALGAALDALDADSGQTMPALLVVEAAVATGDPAAIDRILADVDTARRSSFDDGRLVLAEGRLLDACGAGCERWRTHVQGLADDLVAQDPARSDGWRMQADLAETRGDAAAAEAARRRVIELAPGDDRPWRELAVTLGAAGDLRGAHEAALAAIALDPFDDANLELLGP